MCANLTSPLGTSNLTLIKITKIATGTTAYESSSVAAVYLGASAGSWRLYYQATNGTILELVGTSKAWKAGATLSATDAVAGSPLALSMETAPAINIFYVDSSTSNLFSISYSDGWQTRESDLYRLSFEYITNNSSSVRAYKHRHYQLERNGHLPHRGTEFRPRLPTDILHWGRSTDLRISCNPRRCVHGGGSTECTMGHERYSGTRSNCWYWMVGSSEIVLC
jgi:hypothetical protein